MAKITYSGAGARPSKYRAIKEVVDNITFASKREAARYGELKLLERNGDIFDFALQPKFPLVVDGVKVCTYIGDFAYWSKGPNSTLIVEDVKGVKTPTYRLKRKLLLALHPGLDHREIT